MLPYFKCINSITDEAVKISDYEACEVGKVCSIGAEREELTPNADGSKDGHGNWSFDRKDEKDNYSCIRKEDCKEEKEGVKGAGSSKKDDHVATCEDINEVAYETREDA